MPEAKSLEGFRANLAAGRDSIRPLSAERRSLTPVASDLSGAEFGFIDDIDQFDYRFFGKSKAEADHMDPHQRLLLQSAYRCLESANIPLSRIAASRTAVFVSDVELGYARLAEQFHSTLHTGSMSAAIAGNIA